MMSDSSWDEMKKRDFLIELIKEIAVKIPDEKIEVPEDLQGFGTIELEMDKCVSCGACTRVCEDCAMLLEKKFDLKRLLALSDDDTAINRVSLAKLIKNLMKKEPEKEVEVPTELNGIGTPNYDLSKCVACKKCAEICKHDVLKLKLEWDLPQVLEKHKGE